MLSYTNRIYYLLRPFIPRRLRISIRRVLVLNKWAECYDIWPIDEHAKTPPKGWKGWPNGKKFALVLTHDVETFRGCDKCMDLMKLEQQYGFRSSFNFVAEEYNVSPVLRSSLNENGFEVGLHGLTHDGRLYKSREIFQEQAIRINKYLKEWSAVGFRSPSMLRNLEWILELDIGYDSSTFDTDPFEPQPDGIRTIFPIFIRGKSSQKGYVELPYTIPQDHTVFIILKERDIDIWKHKLDWIVKNGGMALLITHPDYMKFEGKKLNYNEYPAAYYEKFLNYIKNNYEGQYWHVLPKDISRFWRNNIVSNA